MAERPSVKEVIQADIEVILAKIENLRDLLRHQFETKILWTRVAALKHNKSKYKKQRVANSFQINPNFYNFLVNDSNDDEDDTPANTDRSSKSTTNRVRSDKKKNHKKSSVKSKVHAVLILGDSHTRQCASKVKQQLNNEYELCGLINPGSGMKDVKESAKMKMARLTREDIVVLWGGSNDVARNNSVVGMKHILDLLINSTHTNVILLSVPHRHDLINDSCVNREVKVFNVSLQNSLKGFGKVELIEVVSEREFYKKHGQHLNSKGKVSMASRIALTMESMIKRKLDPISVKWYNDAITDSQKCQHQATQEKTGFDDITADAVHSANIVKKIRHPIMIKASDGDTILDEKMSVT